MSESLAAHPPAATGGKAHFQALPRNFNRKPRRLPPYGKLLQERLGRPQDWRLYRGTSADGTHPEARIYAGSEAWSVSKRRIERELLLVAPLDQDPGVFDWSLVAEYSPVPLFACGRIDPDFAAGIVAAILRDGAQRVLYCQGSTMTRFIREGDDAC